MSLLEEVLEAHGGRQRWAKLRTIEMSLASGGLAFTMHMQRTAFHSMKVTVWPHEPRVELVGVVKPGWRGVFAGDRVELFDETGAKVGARDRPRAGFDKLSKNFVWDDLDILYFGAYAIGNYISFPFILDDPKVQVEARRDGGDQLVATFDPSIATHSRVQVFHVDEARHLTRHDYTADVMGGWANAANLCRASEVVDGLRFYTRRIVHPRFGARRVVHFPTLVWIEIEDLRVT